MEKSNTYDFYIALVDQDPLLSQHLCMHLKNHLAHYLNKRISLSLQSSLYDILTMPGAKSLQLCILEPFHDLLKNGFSKQTAENHLAFMHKNNHLTFVLYSQFSDPDNRYRDTIIPYYHKWIQQDDLTDYITEVIHEKFITNNKK